MCQINLFYFDLEYQWTSKKDQEILLAVYEFISWLSGQAESDLLLVDGVCNPDSSDTGKNQVRTALIASPIAFARGGGTALPT